jgi:hypothetical protein
MISSPTRRLREAVMPLRRESRCRLGGGECLPGGSFMHTMDPGRYKVEVRAPHLP